MKKLLLLFVGALSVSSIYAQDINDALLYGGGEIQGTARYRALSGAFGALGGDLSAVSVNPAGSAIFTSSFASLSLSNEDKNNNTSYFNGRASSSNSDTSINQAGAVFVLKNTDINSSWKKFTLSIVYDNTKNYDDDWFAQGTNGTIQNNGNSIADYFINNAQGNELFIFAPSDLELSQYFNINETTIANNESLYYDLAYQFLGETEGTQQQQNFLGYYSYILDPSTTDTDNSNYTSNIAAGTFKQEYNYAATGYNGKVAFNIGAQYDDNLYLGLNLNSHFINYERSTFLYEENSNVGSLVNQVGFENTILTTGTGFSFQLGSIFKVTDEFRIGLSYDSPTWLTIREETTQYIETVRNENGANIPQIVDPQIINIFPQYRLQTPGKVTGSIAYIFGKQGLISFDYSRKDYSKTKFKPTSDLYFASQNKIMDNRLTTASTFRVGGEFKVKQLSFRGGYRFEESPYKDGVTVGDLNGYSLGLGYNFGNTKLDLTFDQSEQASNYQLYNTGLTDATRIDAKNSNITLSLGFNL